MLKKKFPKHLNNKDGNNYKQYDSKPPTGSPYKFQNSNEQITCLLGFWDKLNG
jgi:hypothetical protein